MSFAPSTYPTSLDNTASLPSVALPAVLEPAFWNDLQAAIFAIESFLGTKPGGWGDTDTVVSKIGSGGGGGGDAGWTVPTLVNGWTAQGAPNQVLGFRKLGSGLVICEGVLTPGVLNATVFTLPAGYRPSGNVHIRTYDDGGRVEFEVTPSGDVQVQVAVAPNPTFVSVAGVWFGEQ